MSRIISTIRGATYVVTPTENGTIETPNGIVIAAFCVGAQTTFVAPEKVVVVSDDNAVVDIYFNPAAPSVQGGGRIQEHLKDTTLHLSSAERLRLDSVLPGFSVADPPLPEGVLSYDIIRRHFSLNAQPGVAVAPPAVYISRVPWARWEGDAETGQWVNNAHVVDETVFGVARKIMDNAGLQHKCSTDTVEGVDDYNGKLWPFYWQHGNYITDEYGIKHVTAIKGVHEDFNPRTRNVCSFGPVFWFFCCLEQSRKADGTWNTHDGTKSGTPLFQLWGISTRAWENLDEERRAELESLGVSEADFHLWPGAQVWDENRGLLVERPYWCHSAYCGGYEEDEDGNPRIASKANLPVFNDLSINKINAIYGNRPGFGGSACVQGFAMLFDIVKNATKNSQSIHSGMCANFNYGETAACSTISPGYVFPITKLAPFVVGGTVRLAQKDLPPHQAAYRRSMTVQVGRIEAIETRTLEQEDGSELETLCLVFDKETVEPFLVCTGADKAEAMAAAKELTDAGVHACCFAMQGIALCGETDVVIGKHDGSRTSLADSKHAYRVQGTEYMVGVWMCAADVVAVKGTGEISVLTDGVESVPSSEQYVILHAGFGVERLSDGSLQQFLDAGYASVGIMPAVSGGILNVQMGRSGVIVPVAVGGNGSGTPSGHADTLWTGSVSPARYLSGGPLDHGHFAGDAGIHVGGTMNGGGGLVGGRD